MKKRPEVLPGTTYKYKTGCGNMYVVVNHSEDNEMKIIEIFANIGKAGGCVSAQIEAIAKLVSIYLRDGGPITQIVKHLKGISCFKLLKFPREILSCADAVALAIDMEEKRLIEERKILEGENKNDNNRGCEKTKDSKR